MFELCNVVECMGHFDVFLPNNMVSTVEIPLVNPWKWHFQDSKFQNVPRCLSPKKPVPLVLVEPN